LRRGRRLVRGGHENSRQTLVAPQVPVLLDTQRKEVRMAKIARVVLGLILAVGIAACTSTTGRTAGRNIDDAAITASVKTKLAEDSARTLTAVDVDTVNGIVYLTGTVPDATAKQRATQIARNVDGVARVENNLQTKSAAAGDAPKSGTRHDRNDTY
jgi:osmotically-inducible protein OsmY